MARHPSGLWPVQLAFQQLVTLATRCVAFRTCTRCDTESHRQPGRLAFAVTIGLAIAHAGGFTQPEPDRFAEPEPKPEPKSFAKPVAHAHLRAADKLA